MPNPLRSVQDGKDDFQARRAPRTRFRSALGPVFRRVRVRVSLSVRLILSLSLTEVLGHGRLRWMGRGHGAATDEHPR